MKTPPNNLTVGDVLQHIRVRLQTLGNKTHGKFTDEEKLRAAHGARELAKLSTWIINQQRRQEGDI